MRSANVCRRRFDLKKATVDDERLPASSFMRLDGFSRTDAKNQTKKRDYKQGYEIALLKNAILI